ncbi:hypothetical protein E5345_11335 [Propionibacterium sp. NM47_B9-13]|nr:hypothetical protein HMPREF9621_00793 [Cutibacterium modestum HL037PA2]EFT15750.1 hypothetical protein HMPREF9622_01180 [Cutibacterium modestum HL037PA3]REB75567.1 hypothetical protein CP877_04695 [Cutibacterium modestum]TGY27739.1 hypothetical protein E5345_11335 [Propionibacterium sp. NM47_B9-13]
MSRASAKSPSQARSFIVGEGRLPPTHARVGTISQIGSSASRCLAGSIAVKNFTSRTFSG